jgi:Xaa-Pro aminopeptidase
MGIIKTKKEIVLLKKSAQITNSCIPLIEKSLSEKNITEREIAKIIREKIKKQKASLAFRTIVASGKRASMIHSKPSVTNQVIFGLGYVDFGACYKGYRTDVTVPFIKGKISKKQMRAVKVVMKSYEIAVKSIIVGLPCWKPHQKVDRYMRRKGYKMLHPIGHGLGLRVHELPYIGTPSKKKLKKKVKVKWEKLKKIKFEENMVFTIEPAIYIKNSFGFRFENDVLITKKGPQILTHSKLIKV